MSLVVADVSEFQGTVDWAVYGAVYGAVVVRAHTGYRADSYAQRNIAGARRSCQWRGWYQYLPADANPVTAARAFAATVGPLQPGEVAILDLEEGTGDQRPRRQAWLDAIQAPVEWTYSGLYFARDHLPGVHVEWVAAYQANEPTDAHTLWQYTNARSFAGIAKPCDASVFAGTLVQLVALTSTTPLPEVDMPLTTVDADVLVRRLLGTNLAVGGPTVGVALRQSAAVLDPKVFAAAVVAAMPASAAPDLAAIEAAVRAVFADAATP